MKRFFFGVLVGVVVTLFFQSRGDEILRSLGMDGTSFSRAARRVEDRLDRFLKDGQAGEKAKRKLEEGARRLVRP